MKITFLLLCLFTWSCLSAQPTVEAASVVSNEEIESSIDPAWKDEIIANLSALKEAGFFSDSHLSDEQIFTIFLRSFDILEWQTKDTITPANATWFIATLDKSKIISLTSILEEDVEEGEYTYTQITSGYTALSKGKFNPRKVKEVWRSDDGPIVLSYRYKSSSYKIKNEYLDDMLDYNVLPIFEKELSKLGIRTVQIQSIESVRNSWGGEVILGILRATEAEQLILEKKLNWIF